MTRTTRALACAPALALLSVSAAAQTIETLVVAGDAVPGVGNVIRIRNVAVDDAGHALVQVDTDNANTNTNGALLDENGALLAYEGQSLTAPSGASVLFFSEVFMSGAGESAYLLSLTGTSGTADDEGLFTGTSLDLEVQMTDVSTAPQLPSGTQYALALGPEINDSGLMCFHSVVDDPNVSGTYDYDALMLVDTVGGGQNVLYAEGDLLPGQAYGIKQFTWGSHAIAINNSGQVMFGARTLADADLSHVIYIDGTKIAQAGETSPYGPWYSTLSSSVAGLDLNNNGDYIFACAVNVIGARNALILNGAPFLRERDALPAIQPFKIEAFGQAIFLGDDGHVLWSGVWDSPDDATNRGLFVDETLLVQESVTTIGGQVVEDFIPQARQYSMSASGRYAIFEATLQGGVEGAFLIDLWDTGS